jgi:lysyl-tRNA synthetase class 2
MIKKPDYHQQEEFQNRTRKLADIRQSGIEPYPHRYTTSHSSQGLQEAFYEKETGHSEDAARGDTDEISVAGRLILFRSMGKNSFAHLQDHTGRVQVMFNRDLSQLDGYQPVAEQDGDETISAYKFIEKKLDLGDILGVKGHVFRTQKGELTIFAKEVTLLCKTLLPLADKHEGLHDKELRYRKRWLDLISHPDIATLFRQRTYILQQIRVYFEASEFLEVETPILQSIYGGAEARPFETNLNALDQGMFLRISLEPPLKKLMVGGMHRIYELGRVFRNEGIDRTHNPEFTLLEAYAAYWDYHDMMSFVEKLFEKIAIALHGSSRIPYSLQEGTPITYLDMKTRGRESA